MTNGFRLQPQVKNSRKEWHRSAEEATKISREIAAKYDAVLADIKLCNDEVNSRFAWPCVVRKIRFILKKYR